MSRNPATTAWIVLILSFLTCGLISVLAPLAVRSYLSSSLQIEAARLEVINGTAIIVPKGSNVETATTGSTDIHEGDLVRTTAGSQAMLWLAGGNNVRLWPETAISVVQLRSSRFNRNDSVSLLRQESGHVRVEVGMLVTLSRKFQIATREGTVTLREGSYSIDSRQGRTELVTQFGSATVEGGGQSIEVLQGEMSLVSAGGIPNDPMPSARNLLANADFSSGLNGWQWGNREEEEPVLGTVRADTVDGLPAVRIVRTGASKHAETFVVQNVNRDVTDFQSLKLGLDLRLVQQTLSGGGWLGSEYPLMVKVKYRDVWGSESVFRRGFYYQNDDGHPTINGERVERDVWVKRDAYDLFNRSVVDPRPSTIISVELSASGWGFESMATNIRLIAE